MIEICLRACTGSETKRRQRMQMQEENNQRRSIVKPYCTRIPNFGMFAPVTRRFTSNLAPENQYFNQWSNLLLVLDLPKNTKTFMY